MPAKNTRYISEPDKKMLWTLSAGRCAKPGCRDGCVEPANDLDTATTLCDHAHIFAHSKNGARPNPDGFSQKSNSYENLVLLCSTHHRLVDGQENTYTVSTLLEWKEQHEAWVSERLRLEEFTHVELESIISWLTKDANLPTEDFMLRPPHDKMLYNDFSAQIKHHITQGLLYVSEIQGYIRNRSAYESHYAERLLKPLTELYEEYKEQGLESDYIFTELWDFACGKSLDFGKRNAGLAIIVYFFDRCELFEK